MRAQAWKMAGLAMAVMGSLTLAQAGKGECCEKEKQSRKNKEGQRPSREEMKQRFDADGDGKLNEEERTAARKASKKHERKQKKRKKTLKRFDADGDGKLNEEERTAARKASKKKKS